jgi:hypothetical protein
MEIKKSALTTEITESDIEISAELAVVQKKSKTKYNHKKIEKKQPVNLPEDDNVVPIPMLPQDALSGTSSHTRARRNMR